MAETLISPGVLSRENDQSFITQQPITVGAAIVGPTVKGPVEIPTIVTSYSDFQNRFGSTFVSGANASNEQVYTYLTSIAAYNYFQNGGESLLVARVVSGSSTWDYATAEITGSNGTGSPISGGAGGTNTAAGSGAGGAVRSNGVGNPGTAPGGAETADEPVPGYANIRSISPKWISPPPRVPLNKWKNGATAAASPPPLISTERSSSISTNPACAMCWG